MDVKEAVGFAKRYIKDIYSDESPANVGLEEVEFDDLGKVWRVTVGFSRPWDSGNDILTALGQQPAKRSYKVVTLSDGGEVLSVKNREN